MTDTALIVVDMVFDFTHPDGLVFYPQNQEILPQIAKVVNYCHQKEHLVIFMQHSYRANKTEKNLVNMRPNCIEGTGGDHIDPSLPLDEVKDYVIKKRRYSAFFGTDLDLVLRENGITRVVIVGTKTNCCIRATVTDSYYLDYDTVVLRDCVATNDTIVNEVHLTDISKYFGKVISSKEFMSEA
ncbi:MAG: isochorismatase family cysteine hydrolase [Tissierellia bacterium]|nr:isochorismatase family cysteine hydrolase [Tissierellia bacterium]